MLQTINENQFIEAFKSLRPHKLTIQGLRALYEHLEELGASQEREPVLDVENHCCEYTEYENLAEIWKSYSNMGYLSIEELRVLTEVIPVYNDKSYLPETGTNEMSYIIKDF